MRVTKFSIACVCDDQSVAAARLWRGQRVPHGLQLRHGPDGVLVVQDGPHHRQIFGAELHVGGGGGQRGARLAQFLAIAIAPGGLEIIGKAGRLGLVEGDDALDGILVAIAFHPHEIGREIDAIGREHRMVGDLARALQIFVQQRRRHGQRLAGIVEAGGVGGIDRELAGDLHVLAGQVADGVVVLGVAQTARQHDAGIAAQPPDLLGAHVMHEGDDLVDRLLRRLRHRLGRHLMIGQPVGKQRPAREILLHLVHRSIGLEVELAGGLRAGMAADAILAHKGLHRIVQTILKLTGIGGKGRDRRQTEADLKPAIS